MQVISSVSILSSVLGAIEELRFEETKLLIRFFVRGQIILLGDLMRLFDSTFCQSGPLSEKSDRVDSLVYLIGLVIASGDKHFFILFIELIVTKLLACMV